MPLGRRPLFAVTLGLWLAVLLAMLLGSATVLAVDTVSLGDMRWIGTDPSVTTVVIDRMTLFAALAVAVSVALVRVWVSPGVGGTDAGVTSDAPAAAMAVSPAVHAGVIRLVAGGALLLTAVGAVVLVQLARLLG